MSISLRRLALGATLLVAIAAFPGLASAQTKLKWAHVYEVAEPYHTEALWAADEIKKRTNGRYEIQVFPASQLGNENQINEALGLGTVDMIYTGVAFAGSIHKPIAITNAPFVLRDFDHWKKYRDSKLFRDISKGYEDKTKHKVITLTYYGQRMVTANKEIKKPEDMKGMKLRVPPAPAVPHVHQIRRRQCHADRVRRSLSRLAAEDRGRPGKSAADHHGEEVLRSSEPYHADRPYHRVLCSRSSVRMPGRSSPTRTRRSSRKSCRKHLPRQATPSAPPSRKLPTSCASSERRWSKSTATPSAKRRSRCITIRLPVAAGRSRNTTRCKLCRIFPLAARPLMAPRPIFSQQRFGSGRLRNQSQVVQT